MEKRTVLAACLVSMSALFGSAATAAVDSDAALVYLRTSCAVNGSTIDNCFTDLNTLNSWIWNTRLPSASTPLQVEIGAGTFTGQFSCTDSGYVTLSGAGKDQTLITNAFLPVTTNSCDQLVFRQLTLQNTGNLFGVHNLGGSTMWDNVRIRGLGYAWFDSPGGCGGARGSHYWFSSQIVAEVSAAGSTTAYFNACDESWFFGSEITARGSSGASTPIRAVGGEVHVYGSVIRAVPDVGASMSNVTAVTATGTASIHIHGTGIDVISAQPDNIVALSASNGGHIHANESSYVLKTGAGGSVTRIANSGGMVDAPYLWQTGVTPPAIASVTGSDTVVYTGTGDGHPHLAIYDSSCTSGWYDVNTGSCQ